MLPDSMGRNLGLVGLAACLLAPCASAQNLVANPDFETYVVTQPSDWQNTGAWSAAVTNYGWPDNSLPAGSILLINTSPSAGTGVQVTQCVPVTPGVRYLASLHGFVQSGQASSGEAYLQAASVPSA